MARDTKNALKETSMAEITGEEFAARAGAALGGHGWKTLFAKAIGKDKSTLRRWLANEEPVPAYALAALEFLEITPSAFRPARWMK